MKVRLKYKWFGPTAVEDSHKGLKVISGTLYPAGEVISISAKYKDILPKTAEILDDSDVVEKERKKESNTLRDLDEVRAEMDAIEKKTEEAEAIKKSMANVRAAKKG